MPIRVAWVGNGSDINRGSYRLQVHYNHEWLNAHGVESTVIDFDSRPPGSWKGRFDVVVWFRTDAATHAHVTELPVIYFVSDGPVPDWQNQQYARAIVSDTPWVVEHRIDREFRSKCHVVPVTAAGDVPEPLRRECAMRAVPDFDRPPRLVWVGTEQNYLWGKETLDYLGRRYPLEIISAGDFATRQWRLDTVAANIAACDIAVVPMPRALRFGDTKGFVPLAKDVDRVTLLQACGLPVVASPLPSYVDYIRQGVDGIVADGPEEFDAAIRHLWMGPQVYNAVATAGFTRAWMTASPTITGNKWRRILEDVVG